MYVGKSANNGIKTYSSKRKEERKGEERKVQRVKREREKG
jgi:hypothetical protein